MTVSHGDPVGREMAEVDETVSVLIEMLLEDVVTDWLDEPEIVFDAIVVCCCCVCEVEVASIG